MARLKALLLGCVLATAVFGAGWRMLHPPVPKQDIAIHVADARGKPIENFRWEYFDWTPGAVISPYIPQSWHPGGTASARVPQHRIEIWVEAKGLARRILGPFEPTAIPTRLDVVLDDLKVVTGIVTQSDKPVVGATVRLCWGPYDLIKGVSSGLLSSSDDLEAVTDESGSFRIGAENEGMDYWVRASRAGSAPGTAGPVRVGDIPLEVQLHDGGTIDGVLRLPRQRDPAGAQIELYREERPEDEIEVYGHETVQSDREGRFRFEHVESGPWLVRLREPRRDASGKPNRSSESVPFVVEVMDGLSVVLDMDLTREPIRIEGRPKINGRSWSKVGAFLHLSGDLALVLDWADTDQEQGWTLRVRTPGTYRLVVWGNYQHDTSVPRCVYDVIEVSPTGARWDKDITWEPKSFPEFRLDQTSR